MQFRRKPHGIRRSHAHDLRHASPAPARSRRAGRVRFVVRLFLLLGLLAAVLLLIIVYSPVSLPFLDRQIQSRFRAATGLGLDTGGVTFRISQGTVQIASPRILDPADGRTLLNARAINLAIPFGQFLTAPPYAIESVDIETSLSLPVVIREKKVSYGPNLDRMIAVITESQRARVTARANRTTTPTLGLRDLTIHSANLLLSRERDGRVQPLLNIEEARLFAEFGGRPVPRRVRVSGSLNDGEGAARNLTLELRPDPARRLAVLNLKLASFDSLKDLPWRLPVAFGAGSVGLIARVGWTDRDHWSLNGASTFSRFNVSTPDGLPGQDLGDARARFLLALDRTADRLDVLAANLDSRVCTLQTSGSLALSDPWPYTLTVDPLQAQGPMFAVIASALGRGNQLTRSGAATIGLRATLRGDLRHPLPDATGHIELAGLYLRSPNLPPLDDLRLTATMTTNTLTLANASAIVQGMPMAFTGTIRGRPLRGQVHSADVTWDAHGDLVNVSTLMRGAPLPAGAQPPAALELSGKVAGKGRVFVPEPLSGKLTTVLERTRVEGRIDLGDVTIRHPALLEPVRNLKGRVDFVENTARLSKGSGEWMGLKVTLTGQLKGKPLVWNKPRLTLTGAADFDLDESRARLAKASPAMRERLRPLPPLGGQVDLDLSLETELARPEAADYTATVKIENFDTSFGTARFGGPLRLDELRFILKPDHLDLTRAAGRWGEIKLDLSGDFTPAAGKLRASGGGPLEDLGRRIPIIVKYFRVGGAADFDGEFTVASREGFKAPATWQAWLNDLREQPRPVDWRAWTARRFVFDGAGTINARDAEWTYYAMPARLWGVNGPLRFDMRRLWTPAPVAVRGGERSRDCRGIMELVYGTTINDLLARRPRETTLFTYSVAGGQVALDEWLKPWQFRRPAPPPPGTPPPPARLPYDPKAPVNLRMHGEFKLSSATFRGLPLSECRATLDLDVTGRQYSNYFAWRNIAGRFGAGDFMVEGHQVSTELLTNVIMNNIELEPFIKGLTGRQNVSGIFSGRLSGSMLLTQPKGAPGVNPPLGGSGKLRIIESRFVSNKIFSGLGGLLRLPVFENISFSTIEGPFAFRGERYTTKGIVFDNPTLVHINLVGAYGPAKAMDMEIQLQLLPKAIGRIPLVGDALDLFNKLVGKVLRFKLRGTLDAPVLSPI